MPTVTLRVTLDDIANGSPNEANSCPIALAMERIFFDAVEIYVDGNIKVINPDHSRYQLSDQKQISIISGFIVDFDGGVEEVNPFELELDFYIVEEE